MRTRKHLLLVAGILVSAALFFSACSKDESFLTNDEGQTVLDDALMDATDQDIMTLADQYDDMLDIRHLKDICHIQDKYIIYLLFHL